MWTPWPHNLFHSRYLRLARAQQKNPQNPSPPIHLLYLQLAQVHPGAKRQPGHGPLKHQAGLHRQHRKPQIYSATLVETISKLNARSGASSLPSGEGLSSDGIPFTWTAFGIRNRLDRYAIIFRSSSSRRLQPPTLTALNSNSLVNIGDLWLHTILPSEESPNGSFQLWVYEYLGGPRHDPPEGWTNLQSRIAAEQFPIAYPGNHNLDGGLRYKLSFRLNGDVNWVKWSSKHGAPRAVYEGDC